MIILSDSSTPLTVFGTGSLHLGCTKGRDDMRKQGGLIRISRRVVKAGFDYSKPARYNIKIIT